MSAEVEKTLEETRWETFSRRVTNKESGITFSRRFLHR
uniref:Uncharacterized protein n=1 Tax=Cucumis melo TaxID=3656 RepID=A0A9I9E4S4_CUCME